MYDCLAIEESSRARYTSGKCVPGYGVCDGGEDPVQLSQHRPSVAQLTGYPETFLTSLSAHSLRLDSR